MPVHKGNNTKSIATDRQLRVLELAGAIGGWLTADLVADRLWFRNPNAMSYAYELLTTMVERKRLLTRPIFGRGKVYVVSGAGVHFAESNGAQTTAGLRWGRQPKGHAWMPPMSFAHALRAARFMLFLSNASLKTLEPLIRGLRFDPEDENVQQVDIAFDHGIQQHNSVILKRPDGLAVIRDRVFWVEVEATRKDGADMRQLCRTLLDISQGNWIYVDIPGQPIEERRKKPTDTIVVYPSVASDTRGYRISHEDRVCNALLRALQEQARDDDGAEQGRFLDSEARPLPRGMVRTYFVQETSPGKFVLPEHPTILTENTIFEL